MFDTKKEKYAYVQGLRAGSRGKKPFAKGAPRSAPQSRERSGAGHYRNPDQDDRYWDDFFRQSVNRPFYRDGKK